VTPPPPHDLVRAVRAELATPGRYHFATPHGVRHSWLRIAFGWLADRYKELVEALSKHLHVGPRGLSLTGDVLVVVSVLVVALAGARLLIELQTERSQRAAAIPLAPARSAHALSRLAAQAADAGEYTSAIRLLFAAAVTLLDLRGVLHDDESATVNELRGEVRERRAAAEAPFVEIARAYTAAAYAEEAPDARSWENARSAYQRLNASVASS
jgi:hypothetical protein